MKIDKWRVTTEPSSEPVSVSNMKLHLRVTCTADDALISSLIVASRQLCEDYESRAYITQTITAKLNWLPDRMILPKPRLISVDSIKYLDSAGDEQTLSSDLYDVDIYREPGQVVVGHNDTYPNVLNVVNAVEVIYQAGYGPDATDVPERTISAIKLMCGHLYEHREATTAVKLESIPWGVKALLNARAWTV